MRTVYLRPADEKVLRTFPYGVGLYDNGNFQIATVSLELADRIKNALELYDTLQAHFTKKVLRQGVGASIPVRPTNFVEYIPESSWINKLGFSRETNEMLIVMQENKREPEKAYVFSGVSPQTFSKVLHPDFDYGFSSGVAFNALVKGKYPSRKIDYE